MKKILLITIIALLTQACDDCGKTTYRKEVGVGYVFMYDTNKNISYPVEGAKVSVQNIYSEQGFKGIFKRVAIETYITDAKGRYQVRFVEKGCYDKEEIYCNGYDLYFQSECIFRLHRSNIVNHSQNNVFILDTIKLYK